MKKIFPLLAIAFILCGYLYGRSLWVPLYLGMAGPRTVQDVILKIESKKGSKVIPERTDSSQIQKVTLICIKQEKILEIWINEKFIKTYPMTAFSGGLGPKKVEGDGQIPEGVYSAEYLNPNSSFYLSIKVSYPNAFDREWAKLEGRKHLGGDIFIHGNRVTIGCIPIGDKNIEEVFWAVYKARPAHTKIIISPYDFRKSDLRIPTQLGKMFELANTVKAELAKYPH